MSFDYSYSRNVQALAQCQAAYDNMTPPDPLEEEDTEKGGDEYEGDIEDQLFLK